MLPAGRTCATDFFVLLFGEDLGKVLALLFVCLFAVRACVCVFVTYLVPGPSPPTAGGRRGAKGKERETSA